MFNKSLNKDIFHFSALTLLLSFIFVMLLGLNLTMMKDDSGIGDMIAPMTSCPFMNDSMSICPMTVAEHVAIWNSTFMATSKNSLMQLLLSVVGLVLVGVAFSNLFQNLKNIFVSRFRRYNIDHPDTALFNYLALMIARGIIQPKLYA